MKKSYKFAYFNNYDNESILSKEDFEEILNDNYEESEIAEMDEEQKTSLYYDYYGDYERMAFEDTMAEIKELFSGKVVLSRGSVGRWDGTSHGYDIIGLEEYSDFEEYFYHFSKDCDYFKIGVTNDNMLFLQCSHHDGTNYVEFKVLTRKGEFLLDDYYNGERLQNYTEDEVIQKIWKSKVYSEKKILM